MPQEVGPHTGPDLKYTLTGQPAKRSIDLREKAVAIAPFASTIPRVERP